MSALVILLPGMPDSLRATLESECRALGLRAAAWPVDASSEDQVVVASALAVGERKLPAAVLSAAEEEYPGATVLLVTEERLVRESVTLHDGRLVLLGRPSKERLRGTLRSLLDPSEPPAALGFEQRRTGTAWVAHAAPVRCVVEATAGVGATIPLGSTERLSRDALEETCRSLLTAEGPAEIAALGRELDADVALVRLSFTDRAWWLWWPGNRAHAWLYSPMRLPAIVDIARGAEAAAAATGGALRVAATGGDVVVAARRDPFARGASSGPESLLAGGGGAVLAAIETGRVELDGGLIVEVR